MTFWSGVSGPRRAARRRAGRAGNYLRRPAVSQDTRSESVRASQYSLSSSPSPGRRDHHGGRLRRQARRARPRFDRRALGNPSVLVVDEAQRLPDASRVIKGWHDARLPAKLLLLGSPRCLWRRDRADSPGQPLRAGHLQDIAPQGRATGGVPRPPDADSLHHREVTWRATRRRASWSRSDSPNLNRAARPRSKDGLP